MKVRTNSRRANVLLVQSHRHHRLGSSVGGILTTGPDFAQEGDWLFLFRSSDIVLGLLTRLAVLPTITIMLVAIATTKIPTLSEEGFWEMAHAARTDFSMLLGSLFLLIVGAGRYSVDAMVAGGKQAK